MVNRLILLATLVWGSVQPSWAVLSEPPLITIGVKVGVRTVTIRSTSGFKSMDVKRQQKIETRFGSRFPKTDSKW